MKEKHWISSEALFLAVQESLSQGKMASFTVTGMSMWPFLCHGRDRVVVKACQPANVKKGDIVLLQTSLGNYLLHRVTKVTGQGFETTGDGNCFRDGCFPFLCLRAKVVKLIRKGKEIDCSLWYWRMVFFIWNLFFPIRKELLWLLRKISQLKNI